MKSMCPSCNNRFSLDLKMDYTYSDYSPPSSVRTPSVTTLSLREPGPLRSSVLTILILGGVGYVLFLNSEYILGKLLVLVGELTEITSRMGALGATEVVTDIGGAGESAGQMVERVGQELTGEPDEATPLQSSTQGYCYIGTDRGVRTCTGVDSSTGCMSGDVFPTMDICVNPSLRV